MNSLRPSFLLRQRFSMIGGQCIAKGISLLQNAGIVILDVDSTLIRKEGIDALADYLGKTNEIRKESVCVWWWFFHNSIINKEIPYEDFTENCLNLLRPTKAICEQTLAKFPYDIVDGSIEFINYCKQLHKEVYIVSGGYEPVIYDIVMLL